MLSIKKQKHRVVTLTLVLRSSCVITNAPPVIASPCFGYHGQAHSLIFFEVCIGAHGLTLTLLRLSHAARDARRMQALQRKKRQSPPRVHPTGSACSFLFALALYDFRNAYFVHRFLAYRHCFSSVFAISFPSLLYASAMAL